ncbi:MAG: ubiquitin [Clostridiales bacterium]|nr:ubiquitin [Clostridiales bacterium]
MMATLEQVEKLREKTGVSFEEAKAVLEECNDDLLDAIIYLERQGKVNAPAGGGYYSSQYTQEEQEYQANGGCCNDRRAGCGSFGESMGKFGRFCARIFNIGNTNYLEAEKRGEVMFSVPVTVLVILLIFFFWVVVPLFILSLFFGFRYRFVGNEMGTEQVNKVMDGASDTAEDIKKNFSSSNNNNDNNNGSKQQ